MTFHIFIEIHVQVVNVQLSYVLLNEIVIIAKINVIVDIDTPFIHLLLHHHLLHILHMNHVKLSPLFL